MTNILTTGWNPFSSAVYDKLYVSPSGAWNENSPIASVPDSSPICFCLPDSLALIPLSVSKLNEYVPSPGIVCSNEIVFAAPSALVACADKGVCLLFGGSGPNGFCSGDTDFNPAAGFLLFGTS